MKKKNLNSCSIEEDGDGLSGFAAYRAVSLWLTDHTCQYVFLRLSLRKSTERVGRNAEHFSTGGGSRFSFKSLRKSRAFSHGWRQSRDSKGLQECLSYLFRYSQKGTDRNVCPTWNWRAICRLNIREFHLLDGGILAGSLRLNATSPNPIYYFSQTGV
jgi:hypothetical protein